MDINTQATLYAQEVSKGNIREFNIVRQAFIDGFNSPANSTQTVIVNPAVEIVDEIQPLT